MGSLFRSEEMVYLQAIVAEEAAKSFVHNLAELGCTQLTDLNAELNSFQRRYIKEIQRITEIERKLGHIETQMIQNDISYLKIADLDEFDLKQPTDDVLDQIENIVDKSFSEAQDMSRVVTELKGSLEQAIEFDHVLQHTEKLLRSHRGRVREVLDEKKSVSRGDQKDVPLVDLESDNQNSRAEQLGFQYLAGVVPRAMRPVLERQVFLSSRGNVFSLFADMEGSDKASFTLFFLGGNLRRKLTRICESLNVRLYLYPENSGDVAAQVSQNARQIKELENVLNRTETQYRRLLTETGRRWGLWKRTLIQEMALYTAMNKMKTQARNLVSQMWVPVEDRPHVQDALERAVAGRGVAPPVLTVIKTKLTPPTYFRVDDFTSTFQNIVNTYGVPRYREVNPGLFTIVTFPFLFGMMYGDIGHGSGLFLFGLYLCLNAKKLAKAARTSEMVDMLYGGRYLLTMMGMFAVYVGLVYNDCMSLSIDLFGSTWKWEGESDAAVKTGTYPFGVDPGWHNTVTELAFYNSLKMKLSVIIGITQMTFGLILSVFNHLHFKNYLGIYCEFIPQMIFMMSLFGYLIILILTKWSIDWSVPIVNGVKADGTPCFAEAPNLITTLINMMLNVGVVECQSQLYEGQGHTQGTLVSFALISVPWMLLTKPAILYYQNWQKEQAHQDGHQLLGEGEHKEEEEEEEGGDHGHGHGGKFEFGEICIHQMIHTIEFVLGTVSNTASYLRLWALSLAHAELAKVFFEKILFAAWETGSGVAIVIGTAMWIGSTVMVLMAMDVLECFLHALRLHWVEFQNKFYYADGVAFRPFSYSLAISEELAAGK